MTEYTDITIVLNCRVIVNTKDMRLVNEIWRRRIVLESDLDNDEMNSVQLLLAKSVLVKFKKDDRVAYSIRQGINWDKTRKSSSKQTS